MPNPTAHFETSEGSFEADIYLDRVPVTASNFIALCRSGFYEGLHFHRVIDGFMNQFGCPYSKDPNSPMCGKGNAPEVSFPNLITGGLTCRGPGGTIKDEHISLDSNAPGTLSMANVGQPNTNSSQFFLNVAHNRSLDWFTPGDSKHPVFGIVKAGMDVVTKISKATTVNDKPVTPIRMIKITIVGAPEPPPTSTGKAARRRSSSSSSSSSSSRRRRKKKKKKRRKRSSSSSPDEVRALHILRKHRESQRPSSWRQSDITCSLSDACDFLTALREQLVPLTGKKDKVALQTAFKELAKKHSDCNSAKDGGDLGRFTHEKMQAPFSDAAFALDVGELSKVVITVSGAHLILRVR
ncbi:unnamed protein product [Prorocentrum cordatum]|uniref:peptidylprolyl isomerase n=1 Tax=Prorocentrum cordatum TaxID=2364126 RepID=A0ABN9QCZ4_9DINO|nr:unnamed protein product [Polarella glacialis]